MFKKLVVGLVMVSLVLGLSVMASAEKVKIKLLWGTETRQIHSAVETAFEKAYPNIDLEIIAKPPAQRTELIQTWAAAGQLPDIFSAGVGWRMKGYVDADMILPLDNLISELNFDTSVFADWSLKVMSANGKLYGLPFSTSFRGFLNYNKKIFDEEGIPYPTADMTWDELASLAKQLTIKNEKGETTRYGIFAKWPQVDLFWIFGGRVVNDEKTEMLFGHEAYIKGVQWYRDLVDQGVLMSRQAFTDWGGSKPKLFSEEKFAMIITDIGYGGNFNKADIDFDVVACPRTEKNCGFPFGTGEFSIGYQCKNPKEALQYIIWWTTSVDAMEIWQEYHGDNGSPPTLEALKEPFAKIAEGRKPANWKAVFNVVPYGVDAAPTWEGCVEIIGKYNDAVMDVILGNKPVSYLIEAEAECQKMLDEQNKNK